MNFYIVTPGFNQLDFLKRCVASVRDQVATEGDAVDGCPLPADKGGSLATRQRRNSTTKHAICVHHHVQDGGSTDGTVEWLRQYDEQREAGSNSRCLTPNAYSFSFSSKRDAGMYDALNRGVDFVLRNQVDEWLLLNDEKSGQQFPVNHEQSAINSRDSVIAWLNCDEQYLPHAFKKVTEFFAQNTKVDFLYGDTLLVDPDGELLTFRKNPPLRRSYVLADHLYTQSASMFFRARIFSAGMRFDTSWKAVGDCDFAVRLLSAGFRAGQLRDYLAACTMTGSNLSRQRTGVEELRAFRRTASRVYRSGRPVLNGLRYLEKFMRQGYRQTVPFDYGLYAGDSNARKKFVVQKADFRFKWGSL